MCRWRVVRWRMQRLGGCCVQMINRRRSMRPVGTNQGRRPGGRWSCCARDAVPTAHRAADDALTTRYRRNALYYRNSAYLRHPLYRRNASRRGLPFNCERAKQGRSQDGSTAAPLLLFFFVVIGGDDVSIRLLLGPVVPEGAGELFLVCAAIQMRMRWVTNSGGSIRRQHVSGVRLTYSSVRYPPAVSTKAGVAGKFPATRWAMLHSRPPTQRIR